MTKKRYAAINPNTNKPCCHCMAEANEAFWNAPEAEKMKFKYPYNPKDKIKMDDFTARTYWVDAYENCIKKCSKALTPKCNEKKCKRKVDNYISLEDQNLVGTGKLVAACRSGGKEKSSCMLPDLLVTVLYGDNTLAALIRVDISGPENRTRYTDTIGKVTFGDIKPGEYKVTAKKNDYVQSEKSVVVKNIPVNRVSIKLPKYRSVPFTYIRKTLTTENPDDKVMNHIIVCEKYDWVPEDFVVDRFYNKESIKKWEQFFGFSKSEITVNRGRIGYRKKSGATIAYDVFKWVGDQIRFLKKREAETIDLYRSWKDYPDSGKGDFLHEFRKEKYDPKSSRPPILQ